MASWNRLYSYIRMLLLAGTAGSGTNPGVAQEDPARAAWEQARRADTPEAYERFLELYPLAPYADTAFRTLIERSLDAQDPGGSRGVAIDMY